MKHHVFSLVKDGKVVGEYRTVAKSKQIAEEYVRRANPGVEVLYISLQNGPIKPIEEESS